MNFELKHNDILHQRRETEIQQTYNIFPHNTNESKES